ncbi:MAG: hypothetical protein ACTSV5_04355 [Promethearchaeota archaeon]
MIDQKDIKISVGYRYIRMIHIPSKLTIEKFYANPEDYTPTKLEMLEMLTKIVDNL